MSNPNVKNVAAYIVNKCESQIETLKLQKLVYYCQAWSLAWDGVPLFNEEFQAWANGPVCRELFDMHKGKFLVGPRNFQSYSHFNFSEQQLETMNSVIDFYSNKSPLWLSNLTHLEAPWKLARIGIPSGERSTNIITKESMQEYYGGLASAQTCEST